MLFLTIILVGVLISLVLWAEEINILAGIVFILTILLSFSSLYFDLYGINYKTSVGEHTGYVTAVENNGIIFKTGRIYFKTDNQSSQEDNYCVIDKDLQKKLQAISEERTLVTISFEDRIVKGMKNCDYETAIVTSVK